MLYIIYLTVNTYSPKHISFKHNCMNNWIAFSVSHNFFHFYNAIKQTGEWCWCSKQRRTYLISLPTSSDMSVLHASHVYWPIPSPTMKNRGLGPLVPSILDPISVIYAFGSMLSCILCERQTFSKSHKLKRFGARNQFRTAWFVTVSYIGRSMNAMELVVRN